MRARPHRIKRLVLEVSADDPKEAQHLQAVLGQIHEGRIAPLLAHVCDQLGAPDRLVRLDRLTVDLGELDATNFTESFLAALTRKLKASLAQALDAEHGPPDPDHPDAVNPELEALAVFARTGNLPWWSETRSPTILRDGLRRSIEQSPRRLMALLHELAREPDTLTRLATHFDDASLAALIDLHERARDVRRPDATALFTRLAAQLATSPTTAAWPTNRRRSLLWRSLLRVALHADGATPLSERLPELWAEVSTLTGIAVADLRSAEAPPRSSRLAALLARIEARDRGEALPRLIDHLRTSLARQTEPTDPDAWLRTQIARIAAVDPTSRTLISRALVELADATDAIAVALREAIADSLHTSPTPRADPRTAHQTTDLNPIATPHPHAPTHDPPATPNSRATTAAPHATPTPHATADAPHATPTSLATTASPRPAPTAHATTPSPHTRPTQQTTATANTTRSADPPTHHPAPPLGSESRDRSAPPRDPAATISTVPTDDTPPRSPRSSDESAQPTPDIRPPDAASSPVLEDSQQAPPHATPRADLVASAATTREPAALLAALRAWRAGVDEDTIHEHARTHLDHAIASLTTIVEPADPGTDLATRIHAALHRGAVTREQLAHARATLSGPATTTLPAALRRAWLDPLHAALADPAPPLATRPSTPSAPARNPPQRPTERRRPAVDLGFSASTEIHVNDAGLVLLWPFLGHFMRYLGLTEDNRFRDDAAQQRAAALLWATASGDREVVEYQLPLARVLCDLPLAAPIDPGPPITDDEADQGTRLLEAVIARATILGDMTVGGLRGSFLLRDGTLGMRDGTWLLRVERRGYDVVVDRFPWGFEWVKLPWMTTAIRVEW